MKKFFGLFFQSVLANLFLVQLVLARAGGGGSGGGGGGGGSGGGGGIINFILLLIFAIIVYYQRKKMIEKTKEAIQTAAASDPSWNESELRQRVEEVFNKFQTAWSNLDVSPLQSFLTQDYYKRMVLELNVLKNEHRQNLVNITRIYHITFIKADDEQDDSKDTFTAEINALANDVLLDTATGSKLFVDNSSFVEYWNFKREDGVWKLAAIGQATMNIASVDSTIDTFAKQNNFYYDPDFGWLMMPNKGVLFKQSNFGTSDINNHVVGYYRNKIVEFYTFVPRPNKNNSGANYLVAQAVLPKSYGNILVHKRSFFDFTPSGLNRVTLESVDFEKKFSVFAANQDQVNSLELLTTNFMEKIYGLPFTVTIEIVDNFLYLYTKNYSSSHYPEMLQVLSWAFDEMKM